MKPAPARAGLFIYAKDIKRLAHFYQTLLDMARTHTTPDLVVLSSADLQIIVHAMPPHLAADVQLASTPPSREQAAFKFFYTVPSLAAATGTAATLGGDVRPEQWSGLGFVVRNAIDPEGNIFQLRETTL